MYCVKCGKEVKDDYVFCLYCGAAIPKEAVFSHEEGENASGVVKENEDSSKKEELSHMKLNGSEITEKEPANIITPQLIMEVVSEYFHISVDQMISKSRSNDVAKPRQIAIYLCKNMTDCPLDEIGSLFGGRDHSTIIHGLKKITEEYATNENTRTMIEAIKKKINPN